MKSSIDPYPLLRFDAAQTGPHLLITAGVHGDEYEPMMAARLLVGEMASILTRGTVTVIPVVNKTALAQSSRFGSDGLDLARICPGNSRGSVTEMAAAFVSDHIRQADFYIDLHTGGAAFNISPLAGYMLHSSDTVLQQQRDMALAFGLPVIWGTEAYPNGRTLSVARDANVPAIYAEYGGGGIFNQDVVAAYRAGCGEVMDMLGMTGKRSESHNDPDYWIEDERPNGGYLQGKLPSPLEGIFLAAKKINTVVHRGELLGNISDPVSGRIEAVIADMDGLLFFIRREGHVLVGDSLGGILDLNFSVLNHGVT